MENSVSSFRKRLLILSFAAYLALVAAITILPTHLSAFRRPQSLHINLVPLDYSFRCFLLDRNQHPGVTTFCLRNTLGNIALFLPLGILLPLLSPRFQTYRRVILFALCLSLGIETIQFGLRFFGNPRAVDIDDVILNTLGAAIGFAIYRIGKQGEE
jgi:glycopeptide antibiotics resistance protein